MGPRIIAPVVKPETLLAWVAALFLAASLFSHTVALRLLLLAAGIVLASITVARGGKDIRALPPIWLPFVLWAIWAGLSIAWSLEPERSIKEFRNEVFYTGAALWICYVGAQARNAARIIPPLVAAAAATVVLVALRDFAIGWEHYLTGLHGGPGDHSCALLTLMPCLVIAASYGRRARWPLSMQALCWGLALLFVASAYTTLNRTIWLGFAVQLSLIGVFALFRGRMRWSTRARVFTATFALVIVAGTGTIVLNIQEERDAMGIARAFEQDPRLVLWPEVLEHIAQRPVTGYGFGRGLLRDSLREELGSVDAFLWHAHNLFLEALLQLGVPGLILLLLLLGAILREGWRLLRDPDAMRVACGLAVIAVVAGMVVRNMTDTLFLRQNALLFWGVVGVLLTLGSRRTSG